MVEVGWRWRRVVAVVPIVALLALAGASLGLRWSGASVGVDVVLLFAGLAVAAIWRTIPLRYGGYPRYGPEPRAVRTDPRQGRELAAMVVVVVAFVAGAAPAAQFRIAWPLLLLFVAYHLRRLLPPSRGGDGWWDLEPAPGRPPERDHLT